MLFIENLSNNEVVPNVAKTAILYFDSIEAKFLIHYLQHCVSIFQLGSESKSYNIITIFHYLHARAFQIGMGYSCFDCVALARRYFFVFEQARHQYANVIGKLLLQSQQNVLPLRYDGLCILQKPVNHVFLSLFWQLNHLRYDLFYASRVPRGQQGKRIFVAQGRQLLVTNNAKETLELRQSQEHLRLLIIVLIYFWFLFEQPLRLLLIGMKLDRQSFFDTQHFKQKGQVRGMHLREVLAQSLIA